MLWKNKLILPMGKIIKLVHFKNLQLTFFYVAVN